MANALPEVSGISSDASLESKLAELKNRIEALENENAELRRQLEEGFRDSVQDFSNSLLESIDFMDSTPNGQKPRS